MTYISLSVEGKGNTFDFEFGSIDEKVKLSLETRDFESAPSSYCEEFEKDAARS